MPAQAIAPKGPHAWSGLCTCLQNPLPVDVVEDVKDEKGIHLERKVIDTLEPGSLRRNPTCPLHGRFGDANIPREHAGAQAPEGWDKPERALREAIELGLVDEDEAYARALADGLVDEDSEDDFRAAVRRTLAERKAFSDAVKRGDVDDPT